MFKLYLNLVISIMEALMILLAVALALSVAFLEVEPIPVLLWVIILLMASTRK